MVIRKDQAYVALLAGWLMLSSAIAGCTKTEPSGNSQPKATPPAVVASSATSKDSGIQRWTTVLKGEPMQGLTFTNDGKLLYQNNVLLKEIPVSDVSNGNVTYAQRLIVSNLSPSGRFNVIRACESPTNDTGVCWAVFLFDRQSGTIEKISIAKYGGQEWVEWTADERYAVFAESMEGVSWFVVLDVQTRETKMFEQTAATANLASFKWIDDRTFVANVLCSDRTNCPKSQFRGNISQLFAKSL